MNDQGVWLQKEDEIAETACSYFEKLFSSTSPSVAQLDRAVEGLNRRVSDANREMLDAPFTKDNIEDALMSMYPIKASGQDGFTAGFYQKHWKAVGFEVTISVFPFSMKIPA